MYSGNKWLVIGNLILMVINKVKTKNLLILISMTALEKARLPEQWKEQP